MNGSRDPVLIGVDVGTSSVRAIAFDPAGQRVASAARQTPMRVTETGGEYDPDAIFDVALEALSEVGKALGQRAVAGIAATSVGESCVLIDAGGQPLAPSIVWHDRRTEPQAQAIEQAIGRDRIFEIAGHAVDPIFALAKLLWMREHWSEAFGRARRVLMMADWIAFRLSGETGTDATLASRSLYFDIRKQCWSDELLSLAGISADFPPPVLPSGTPLGPMRKDILAKVGLAGSPIVAVGGHDHIVGALATGLNEPGAIINSIGSAEALLVASDHPLGDPDLLRRGYVQGAIEADRRFFYLAASLLTAGAAIEWFRRIAGGAPQETLIAEASAVPAGSGGVVFVPHLSGGAPPHPDVHAHGAFLGLTQVATPPALYRAVLEGVALQSRLMLDGLLSLAGAREAGPIRVIGGTSRNHLFLKIKASAFDRPLLVVEEAEATALGAALFAGVGAGVYPSFDAARRGIERREHPVEPEPEWAERYARLRTKIFEGVSEGLRPINKAIAALAAN